MAEMDETVQGKVPRLNVHQAVDLEKWTWGKSDPYCVISYEEQESKTKVLKKMLSPTVGSRGDHQGKGGGDNHTSQSWTRQVRQG